MKKLIVALAVLGSIFASVIMAQAADVGVSININLGEPPVFIAPPSLGFYVAVGIPYDMFMVDMNYYMYRGGGWYVSSGYYGPWAVIQYNRLPRGLRNHKYREIVTIRDNEYRNYQRDRDHYQGKQYRPENRQMRQGNQGNQKNQGNQGNKENKENNRGGNSNKGHGNK